MPSATAQGMRLAHAISKPNLRPLNHPISQSAQHNTLRYKNEHDTTYQSHQRRSRLHDSAAMWLQEPVVLR
jgi:hypothetical protein